MSAEPLLSLIQKRVQAQGDSPAVINIGAGGAVQTSFADLWTRASCFAPSVEKHFGAGKVVPLFLNRSVDCLALMIACLMTGRAFAVLNSRFKVAQIEHVLEQSGAEALWIDGVGLTTLKQGTADMDRIRTATVLAVKNEHWLSMHDKQARTLGSDISLTVLCGDQLTPPAEPPRMVPVADRPGACLFTSGSTGAPKGVLIADSDLVSRALGETDAFGLKPDDRVLNILPWSFDVGLNQVLSCWINGCALAILHSPLPTDIIDAVARFRITGLSAVPAIWTDFLSIDGRFADPKPRYVTVSGGSLAPEVQNQLVARLDGVELIKTYGQTETFRSTIAMNTDVIDAPASIGKPVDGARVYIVDERLNAVPAGVEGEVLHAGNGVMLGYLDGNHAEKRIANPFCGQNGDNSPYAIMTGDRGRLDPQGRLYLLGRADDLIKVQGNRVYISEVEAEALHLPEIQEAVGILFARADQPELFLFVVTAPAAGATDTRAIRKSLARKLPSYMMPKDLIVLRQLPRTSNGKPDRVALKNMLAEPAHV